MENRTKSENRKAVHRSGNAGTQEVGENVAIKADDFEAIKRFVLENGIDMLVVGPEDPLVKGIYDFFRNDEALKNIPVIGPSKAGATLEGSKDSLKGSCNVTASLRQAIKA